MNRRDFIELAGAGVLSGISIGDSRWMRRRLETDVLVYGGGASGVCAAIQAARSGVSVLVIEPTVWLGGMITAAGVSALDGNKHGLGAGLVGEFRSRLLDHYGSDEALFSGWVSLTCFEPSVGESFLRDMVADYSNLKVLFETDLVSYERPSASVRRVVAVAGGGERFEIDCQVFLDCSEYGDGLQLAGMPNRLGRESRDEYEEDAGPEVADMELQDLTYVATLALDATATADPGMDDPYWKAFDCSTLERCTTPVEGMLNHQIHGWDAFISYGRLPNDKVMLNWPHHSNDYPVVRAMFEDRYYRRIHLASAKQHTLKYVEYMRHALGHPEWVLATDEYPSDDHLPLIPYIRESRRLVNGRVMAQSHVIPMDGKPRAPQRADSVAVGDYYLDHHHSKDHLPPDQRLGEAYPENAPFQISPDIFMHPESDDRFLAVEKNVAVSHIVNGCTRLQPVVMLMGQAAGALAAQAVAGGVGVDGVSVPVVQARLIEDGCQLYPVYDLVVDDPAFGAVQRLGIAGVLGDDEPTRLELDGPVGADQASKWLSRAGLAAESGETSELTRREILLSIDRRMAE